MLIISRPSNKKLILILEDRDHLKQQQLICLAIWVHKMIFRKVTMKSYSMRPLFNVISYLILSFYLVISFSLLNFVKL